MVTPDLFFLMSFLHHQPYITTFLLDFMDLCFSNYIMAGNFELYVIFFSLYMITQHVDESHLFLEMIKVSQTGV